MTIPIGIAGGKSKILVAAGKPLPQVVNLLTSSTCSFIMSKVTSKNLFSYFGRVILDQHLEEFNGSAH